MSKKPNIVMLERNSVGPDIDVSCFEKLGNVTYYLNTVTKEEVRGGYNNSQQVAFVRGYLEGFQAGKADLPVCYGL